MFKALTDTTSLLGECPVWCERTERLFWTDIPGCEQAGARLSQERGIGIRVVFRYCCIIGEWWEIGANSRTCRRTFIATVKRSSGYVVAKRAISAPGSAVERPGPAAHSHSPA
ncbi:MAG: SMP-30/gluconolactonase/LRE family protein [Pseudomonas sp.]|uniref:SMP-30/gluconolactonase/LRE family protein n=1 Tax=Pseudomonas sp. TaxID=306 RepID=UPI003D135B74